LPELDSATRRQTDCHGHGNERKKGTREPFERIAVVKNPDDVAEHARQARIEPPSVLMIGPTVGVASAPMGVARRGAALARV